MNYLRLLIAIFAIIFTTTLSLYSQLETPNSFYLGLSAGHNLDEGHNEFSLMGGYDRHFEGTPEFTLGILAEGVFGEHSFFMMGIPIGFYPLEEVKLWIAPCYSLNGDEKEYYYEEEEKIEYMRPKSQFMLKFGGGYNYHFHGTNVSMLPFVEGTLVYKEFILSIGIKFNFYFPNFFSN